VAEQVELAEMLQVPVPQQMVELEFNLQLLVQQHIMQEEAQAEHKMEELLVLAVLVEAETLVMEVELDLILDNMVFQIQEAAAEQEIEALEEMVDQAL
jgi:hypothetical protein